MAGYTNRSWVCPFFKWDERLRVHCEGGRQVFPDGQAARDYAGRYCACMEGWKNCSVADNLLRYYEREARG